MRKYEREAATGDHGALRALAAHLKRSGVDAVALAAELLRGDAGVAGGLAALGKALELSAGVVHIAAMYAHSGTTMLCGVHAPEGADIGLCHGGRLSSNCVECLRIDGRCFRCSREAGMGIYHEAECRAPMPPMPRPPHPGGGHPGTSGPGAVLFGGDLRYL